MLHFDLAQPSCGIRHDVERTPDRSKDHDCLVIFLEMTAFVTVDVGGFRHAFS